MAGKTTYADLVKKNVANFSPEPADELENEKEPSPTPITIIKTKKSKSTKKAESQKEVSQTNGDTASSKSVSPAPVQEPEAEVKIEPEVEVVDDIGFKLVKGRERKHSISSRQSGSGYRNSSGKPGGPKRNYKKSESDSGKRDSGKKLSFDEKRDEEKLKYLNRFPKKESVCFELKAGDVFSAEPHVSLAHCVSEDFEAKDGISKLFKERYGNEDQLLVQNSKTGGCAYLKDSNGRFIFYMVTRNFSFHRPYYSALEKCFKELRNKCNALGVTDLAMPLIGNRQDQLEWDIVSSILDHVFGGTNVNLTVFKYKSERRPPPSARSRKRVEE